MTKRVAWFTGEASVKEHFTPNIVYEVFKEDGDSFNLIDDAGDTRFCLKKGCAHICNRDWVFADVVEEEVKSTETVKREGVIALLPEDSKFSIGQGVMVVDSGFYRGEAVLRGAHYERGILDGYIVETLSPSGASPKHGGLCKDGHALWVFNNGIEAIAKWVEPEQAVAAPKKTKKWSEWLPHTTNEQPVADDVIVKVKFSDGTKGKEEAGNWGWFKPKHDGDGAIRFYKVKLEDLDKLVTHLKPKRKWTKNAGVMPVDSDVKVKFKQRDGCKFVMAAHELYWKLDGDDLDIIKWRLAD